jgi:hypothetical protein
LLVVLGIRGFLGKSAWANENVPGLLLLFSFSFGYFLLAILLNKPDINTNNIYFAADNLSWYERIAEPEGWSTDLRAVHPLAYVIFRPVTALVSVLTYGDRFAANLSLLAFAGGGCVFLMWKIVREISGNDVHAILFASLLGESASHLVFASIIESYIFSAFLLLLFIWLLITRKPAHTLIAAGVLTLGITLTNIAQQALMALLIQRNFKRVVFLFAIVVLLAAGLNILSRFIYPNTEYFFIPQNLTAEQRFSQVIDLKRVGLLAENLLVYNVAAPQPYSSLRNGMPRFNFLNGSIGNYTWFGWPSPLLWIAVLSLAFFQFIKNIRSSTKQQVLLSALLTCLAFNFLLHIGYGIEPFLYSADWTYALVLFVGVSLSEFAERAWFKTALFGLVAVMLVNNLWLAYFISRSISQSLG